MESDKIFEIICNTEEIEVIKKVINQCNNGYNLDFQISKIRVNEGLLFVTILSQKAKLKDIFQLGFYFGGRITYKTLNKK